MATRRPLAARALERGALLLSLVLSACRGTPAVPPGARELAARMVAGKFSAPASSVEGKAHDVHYQLFVPASYSSAKRYPLIVSLHGAGSHGTDNLRQLSSTVGALIDGAQTVEPTFVLVPQDPTGDKWVTGSGEAPYRNFRQVDRPQSSAAGRVLAGLDELEKKYAIDPDRVYLTGGSAGGTGTWDLITRNGVGRFAAAVPITGANDPSRAGQIARLPIWAFHGARDNIAPVENSREMVAALRALGSPIKYTEYPDTGHESWNRAYAEPDLFPWLLAQKRGTFGLGSEM
jgi:predicted peptidase